jgi:hypothetical protein
MNTHGIHLIIQRARRVRSRHRDAKPAMSSEDYLRLAKQLRAQKRGIYLLTPVSGSKRWRLQGPDNTDSFVDSLDAGLDALSCLSIVSVEITATVPDAEIAAVTLDARERSTTEVN